MLFLAACGPNLSAAPDTEADPTQPDEPPVVVLADGVEGGAFLSGAVVGDEVLVLGGSVNGGAGLVGHLDGERLCIEASPTPHAMWWGVATGDDEWWAVGEYGAVLHEVGGVREEGVIDPDVSFFGVYADEGGLWAVGTDVVAMTGGAIWRYAGGAWSPALTGIPGPMLKGWGGWFVGDHPLYHLEDGALVDRTLDPPQRLVTVTGRAEDDVWAVGGGGDSAVWRWDGAAWATEPTDPTCLGHALNGVWTAPGEDVWVAGDYGTLARWDGASWTCPSTSPSFRPLHAVVGLGEHRYFFGGTFYDAGEQTGTLLGWGEGLAPLDVGPCD